MIGVAHIRRVASQGALVSGAFIVAQAASFARNAILGHWLAKGDFGIAALITVTLQLVEILSDLAADRLILQDADGDRPHLMATLHSVQVVRGLLLALALVAAGDWIAHFFARPDMAPALQAMGLVPLIKGFLHLDMRRRQRDLDNLPFAVVEALPQVLALALTVPALSVSPGYAIVVWLALAQALAAVALSHLLADRPYRVGLDGAVLRRLARFSWPIWLSAIPLVAVYQGDRLIVGRMIGIEALAGYSAVFMLAMVPGLLAAKLGQSLMLPMLARARGDDAAFAATYRAMVGLVAAWAAAYLAGFVVAGGTVTQLAFGTSYAGLGAVAGLLGGMWAIRMVQAVPGMALMTLGDTRPLLTAGTLRAVALLPAGLAAAAGHDLAVVAAAGVVGEVASLVWLARSTGRHVAGLGRYLLARTAALAPVALASALVGHWLAAQAVGALVVLMAAAVLAIIAALAVLAADADIRRAALSRFGTRAATPALP